MRSTLTALTFAFAFSLTACGAEIPATAVPLFNGKDFAGWDYVTPNKEAIDTICHLKPGGVVLVDGKPNGFLATKASYENYKLHAEWRWADKPGNGGVLL